MTVVAVWCRHEKDDIIGIGQTIPWRVESDTQRFLNIVAGQTVVLGRKTYESLPNLTIANSQLFVMSSDADYVVSDVEHHKVICNQKVLADIEEDLYVAGGAEVYDLFLKGKEKLKPQIIVDCIYSGELDGIQGKAVAITDCVNIMQKMYRQVSPYYQKDDVVAALWVRKGEFVEQSVLKRLLTI